MFNNKQTDFSKANFDTLVGANTEVTGNITSKGIIRIDGKVIGNVSIQGDLFLGENSSIKGDITASNIHLAGSLEGNAFSSGLLKLLPTSKLFGDIQVKSFVCDEGSIFEGSCKMVDSQTSKSFMVGRKKDFKKSTAIDVIESDI